MKVFVICELRNIVCHYFTQYVNVIFYGIQTITRMMRGFTQLNVVTIGKKLKIITTKIKISLK